VTTATVTDGDITISNDGAIDVVDINGDTTDGVVTITSGGALTSTDAADAVQAYTLAIGSALTVGGDSGNNVKDALWFDTDVTNLNITTAGATYIDEVDGINLLDVTTTGALGIDAAGTLTIKKVSSAGKAVFLTTTADIVDGGEADTDVTSLSLRMTAGTGIGDSVASSALETAITTLAATTVDGDIQVANTGALIVGTLDAVAGVTVTGGAAGNDIVLTAASPLTVNTAVVNTGGGNITLAALGAAAADDLTLNADVTATGGAGTISLYAGDTVSQTAGIVSAAGAGAVTVRAGEDWTDGLVNQDGNAGGDIIQADGTSIVSTDSNVTLDAADNITVESVIADANGAGTATLNARAGGIEAVDDVRGTVEVTAGNKADLDAATGIGAGGNDVDVNAPVVEATTTDGSIGVFSTAGTGAVNATLIAAGTGANIVYTYTGTDAAAGDLLTVSGATTTDGTITITGTEASVSIVGAVTAGAAERQSCNPDN